MKFKDKHRFVRSNMKRNRTRVWMTILASTIGCAFLIMLASVGFAIHKTAVDDVMSYRLMNEIQIQKENGMITDKEVKKLEKMKDVKVVTRKKHTPANEFMLGDYMINTTVFSAHMPSEIKAGFELDRGRLPENKNEIVVGYHFAEQLTKKAPEGYFEGLSDEESQEKHKELIYKEDLIGKTLTYHLTPSENKDQNAKNLSVEVKVVGIGKKPTKKWAIATDAYITEDLRNEVVHTLFGKNERDDNEGTVEEGYDDVKVYTSSAEKVKAVSEEIEKMNLLTYSVASELKELNLYFTLFKAGLIFIGGIAVLIASIGIFNTMTMAVTERSQDIGIMKAIGATPKTIKRIFLLESGYIGLWGVGLGTLLAYLISYGVNFALPIIIEQFLNEKPPEDFILSYIPWSLTVIAVTICMGVTLLSGWRPAAKATTVDVLKALRRDV
ncbi:ABC transporter permease [Fictibacillus sp. b24]|uniref:ABC transporter permease n=1 Tax=Fictibacillus sp. b24 TaxID=3055863 RepID=UPI0025A15E5B|nr:ABC transporter permease [Fictibacillus sp. b24]MDM5315282.1 ABC transporter permease [Fictibacillus sp. b24]